jgi:hypothetical protein
MQVIVAGRRFNTFLIDDGSLDTVIRVQPVVTEDKHGKYFSEDIRFDREYANQFRYADGRMKKDGLRRLSREAAEDYVMGGECDENS